MKDTRPLIFDSSSLIRMIRDWGEKALFALKSEHTIDLASYEIGNVLWKMVFIHKSITRDEALMVLLEFQKFLQMMKIHPLQDPNAVLQAAVTFGITYYDASYVNLTIKLGGILVTDDRKLINATKNRMTVVTCKELLRNRNSLNGDHS